MKSTVKKKIKYLTLLGIAATLVSVGIASAQRNSFTVTDRNGKEVIAYQESHALVIWVGNYQHWGKLNNVENEAKDVKIALEKKGFQVTVVGNPNSNQLENKIKEFIDNYGYIRNNRLVIFFAGHGHTRQETRGYLVPVDAPDPTIDEQGFLRTALPMRQIMTWAELMEAKHVLFVFDSCFSGTIFKQRSQFNARDRYIQDVMNKPVRQFLTAGDADEKVPAESVFTPLFIRAIEGEADLYKDGYVTGTELGLFLRQNLSVYTKQQTPQFGTIKDPDLDQGDIVFRVSNSTVISINPPPPYTKPRTEITPTPPPRKIPSGTRSLISKSTDVDYTRLRQLLEARKWKKADELTYELMLAATNRKGEGLLNEESFENFPCEDWRIINREWVAASDGKFGFSVQKKIWQQAGGPAPGESLETWRQLWINIGWKIETPIYRANEGYISYNELMLDDSDFQEAPEGHLPRMSSYIRLRRLVEKYRYRSSQNDRSIILSPVLVKCSI